MQRFKKKSGDYMILPHYLAVYTKGDMELNEEYSDYKWVKTEDVKDFETKIYNMPESVNKLLKLRKIITDKDVEII